jgi:hypothetical protein
MFVAALDFVANDLALWPVIIQRLTDEVPDLAEVGAAGKLDEVLRNGEPTPAAYVLFTGDLDLPGMPGRYLQQWQVVLITRPALSDADESLAEPGRLLSLIKRALFRTGWCPADNVQAPERVYSIAEPAIYENGLAYFTVSFTFELPIPIQ